MLVDFGCSWAAPSVVGGIGKSIKYFPRLSKNLGHLGVAAVHPPSSLFGSTTPNSPFATTPNVLDATGALVVPGGNRLNGVRCHVVAAGNFLPSASIVSSETVNVQLSAVTGPVNSPTYTFLADINGPFAPGVDGIWYDFLFDVKLFGSNNSGIVSGYYTSMVNNTIERNNAPLQNSLTGIDYISRPDYNVQQTFGVAPPGPSLGGPFGLVVGVTFSQTDSQNQANLFQFYAESNT